MTAIVCGNKAYGSNAHAFVNDRNTKFASQIVCCFNKIFGAFGNFIVYFFGSAFRTIANAIQK